MQRLKNNKYAKPIPINTKKEQHLANLTTQVFCSLLSKYDAPFSLRDEQIDKLIKISYRLACQIDSTVKS